MAHILQRLKPIQGPKAKFSYVSRTKNKNNKDIFVPWKIIIETNIAN